MKIVFEGIFFDRDEVLKLAELIGTERLEHVAKHPHVTTSIYPKKVLESYTIGEKVKCEIVGYGNDGQTEGVLVKLPEGKPCNNTIPHIMISNVEGAKTADTSLLVFEMLPQSVYLEGTFGRFDDHDKKVIV